MPFHRIPRFRLRRRPIGQNPHITAVYLTLLLIVGLIVFISAASKFLKSIAAEMALSDATDMITAVVNEKINEKMSEGKYDYDYFVTLQKDDEGNITAISANMTRINSLSSVILREVIESTSGGKIDLYIPIGNLTGSNLLIGRGPKIPVKVIMLTSSYADFRNELVSAGINQIKHQIILEVTVQVDVLMPWEMRNTEIQSEILIAETIIVGKVPNTYLNVN